MSLRTMGEVKLQLAKAQKELRALVALESQHAGAGRGEAAKGVRKHIERIQALVAAERAAMQHYIHNKLFPPVFADIPSHAVPAGKVIDPAPSNIFANREQTLRSKLSDRRLNLHADVIVSRQIQIGDQAWTVYKQVPLAWFLVAHEMALHEKKNYGLKIERVVGPLSDKEYAYPTEGITQKKAMDWRREADKQVLTQMCKMGSILYVFSKTGFVLRDAAQELVNRMDVAMPEKAAQKPVQPVKSAQKASTSQRMGAGKWLASKCVKIAVACRKRFPNRRGNLGGASMNPV